jgi:hypothetical protein
MNCDQAQRRLARYFDDAPSSDDLDALHARVERCADCHARYLDALAALTLPPVESVAERPIQWESIAAVADLHAADLAALDDRTGHPPP